MPLPRISHVFLRLIKRKVEVLHPVSFVNKIIGNFSMLSLNETADLS